MTVPAGGNVRVFLQWDEAWGQAATDLDLYFAKADGTALPTQQLGGGNDNFVTTLPMEAALWSNSSGSPVSVSDWYQPLCRNAQPFHEIHCDF